jgi:Fe-S cluster assembly protein SufD
MRIESTKYLSLRDIALGGLASEPGFSFVGEAAWFSRAKQGSFSQAELVATGNATLDEEFLQVSKSGGFNLEIPADAKNSAPMRLEVLSKGSTRFRGGIKVGARAQAEFFLEIGGDGAGLSSGILDIEVAECAELRMVSLGVLPEQKDHFLRHRLRLGKGSRVHFYSLGLGGRKGQEFLDVALEGEASEFSSVGAILGNGSQHMEFHAEFHHLGSRSQSSLQHWSVLSGEAKGVFNGLVKVERTALHTESSQKSRTLLLSRKAVMHAMPRLVIATDEVASSHGASVSQVDPEQLFYLMSRGIDEREAVKMVVMGFTEPVLDGFSFEEIRERARTLVEEKFDAS